MSTVLYRLGRAAYARRWWVIGGWLVIVAVLTGILITYPVRLSSEIRINGTPAQQVIDSLATSLPAASGGQGLIAFQAPAGTRIDQGARRGAVLAAVDRIYGMPHVIDARKVLAAEAAQGSGSPLLAAQTAIAATGSARAAAPPETGKVPVPLVSGGQQVPGVIVSGDGSVALLQFQFDQQTFALPQGTVSATVDAARQAVAGQHIAVLPSATMIQLPKVFGPREAVGVLVAAVVLVLTLGSVMAAGLPLATALLGVAVGVGGAFSLSHLIEIHSLAVVLALMLGLAVGMDYALFIVNRQRRLILTRGLPAGEAAARAVGTAGSAVFFAGTTVIIALAALTVVNIRVLTVMAVIAAATVALAVLISLTLLPALLSLLGERIVSARARAAGGPLVDEASRHPVASRWVGLLVRRRYLAVAIAITVAGVLAIPAAGMFLGLPSGANYDTGTAQRRSFDVTAQHFGDGYNGPLLVVANAPESTGRIAPRDLAGLYQDLTAVKGVAAVNLAGMNAAGSTAILTVIPTSGPTDATTAALVRDLRQHAAELSAAHHTAIGVTGFAALAIDVSARLRQVLPVYVAVVLALSLLVLLLVFRSVLVPVKATVGFLLSLFATLGVTTAVFQWGWLQSLLGMHATSPVLSILPIFVTGVLYGLAMDYEVFLVSSIKEAHVHGEHGHTTIIGGFTQASRVVTAAAIIMTSVFAGFIFNTDPMIRQFGFALATGILIDAFLVRMTLVPAVMAIAGDGAWWLPRPLDRLLPNLDIEGDKLATRLTREPVPEPTPGSNASTSSQSSPSRNHPAARS